MKRLFISLNIFFICTSSLFSQIGDNTSMRLEKFIHENSKITSKELVSDTLAQTLKHKVYFITLETRGMHNNTGRDLDEFIVIDIGDSVCTFERNNTNTQMPQLLSYIKRSFVLNPKTAPIFQGLLDLVYPIPDWKPNKRGFLEKNGKWYFLRDSFFDTKQGFEISVDDKGKIMAIRYKMRWDSKEGS